MVAFLVYMFKKSLLERLIDYYGISLEEYESLNKEVTFDMIPSYRNFERIDDAVNLVKKHISLQSKAIIYGDYDVDGISGTSILYKALKEAGLEAAFYIPSRYIDGYGINVKRAQDIVSKGYQFVICVDNGVSANEAIEILKNNNIEVLVIDHHNWGEKLPDADVIIHPELSHYSKTNSSAGFTSFMFSVALLGRFDQYLATLAAISIVTDSMPLVDYNRDFVRLMTSLYKKDQYPAIELLLDYEDFNYSSIGMKIGPKLNSIGRVIKEPLGNRAVRFLTSDNAEDISKYYVWINEINDQRKQMSQELKLEANLVPVTDDDIIVAKMDVVEGLLGNAALELMNRFNKPAIVFTVDSLDEEVLKGSGRSLNNFSLSDAFTALDELIITHGGHSGAAGITIRADKLEEFRTAINEYAKTRGVEKVEKKAVPFSINEINAESLKLIESFSPFGQEWPEPRLEIKRVKVEELKYTKNDSMVRTPISRISTLVGFNIPKEKLSGYSYIDLYGSLKANTYFSKDGVDFHISDYEKSK